MIERLWVQILAGMAGEFSSPELTLCADSYSVSVPPPCYCSGTWKTLVILPKVQVAARLATVDWSWPKKSGVSMRKLISTFKWFSKRGPGREWMVQPSPPNPHKWGKSNHHHQYYLGKANQIIHKGYSLNKVPHLNYNVWLSVVSFTVLCTKLFHSFWSKLPLQDTWSLPPRRPSWLRQTN